MHRRLTILLAAILCFHGTARADYYSDSQKGWWWGDRSVELKEEDPEEKPESKPAPEEPKKKGPYIPPPLSTVKYEDVWNMHPDDFYELQEAYKKKAVQDPSEANTKDYYELQEIGRKKALAFSNASQFVWQKHPELTTAKDQPVNTPGKLALAGNVSDERKAVLKANRDQYALIYFWQPGCSFCDAQKKILQWVESEIDWVVKPVNILDNPGLAAKVGVETTPTIVLIKKGQKDHFPVSSGVIQADVIEDKIYRAVRLLNGDISPQEYSIYDFQKGGGYDVNGRKDWVK